MDHKNHKGLTSEEVKSKRLKYGLNILTPPAKPSIWKLYLENFQDPVIKILLVAAALSLIISVIENEYAETIGIIIAILLATGIGFYFEYDANKKFDLLNKVNDSNPIKVIRDGKVHQIPQKEVVVDDLVLLEAGDEIPADGKILESISLQVNESSLTGELVTAKSEKDNPQNTEATYPTNILLKGTTIVGGHALMKVLDIGDSTEIGKVSKNSTVKNQIKTPLNLQLDKLAKFIEKAGYTIAIISFLAFTTKDLILFFQTETLQGWELYLAIAKIVLKYFMVAVTLIVVAVPEGLPMSVTLSLALNMRRMLKTNNLVRKMHASETMGAITVICTDKTGTLTQNQMRVAKTLWNSKISDESLIINSIAINSTAYLEEKEEKTISLGNPTEGALLIWLKENKGIDYLKVREESNIIDQLSFSTERKYMATYIQDEQKRNILLIKGAPEILFSHCEQVTKEIKDELTTLQNQAMRTLCFAYYIIPEDRSSEKCLSLVENNNSFQLIGITGINDPLRQEVPNAIAECNKAGVDVKMVTGDSPNTARQIALDAGLIKSVNKSAMISGEEFSKLSEEEALKRAREIKVMSRARPSDKQRLVQTLQSLNEVVAVTGDGTNDAPALNHAQVGLSMGSGTSVAKEASDITLLNDSFQSITTAIMWGRSLYKNIQRFIVFQLTINFVALLIVLIASIIGHELPLTVTQMLWVNLIMDTFAAMALASIPPSKEVMTEKPRKNDEFIINKTMRRNIITVGSIFVLLLLGVLYGLNYLGNELSIKDLTIFFTLFVMLQFFNLLNAKVFGSNHSTFHKFKNSRGLHIVLLLILGGQFMIVQFGNEVFRTVPLDLLTWFKIIAFSSMVLWCGEIKRWIKRNNLIK